MKNYKREISEYLDEVKNRKFSSTDEVLKELSCAKYVCIFGLGAISYPIIAAMKKISDIKINFLSDNDPSKWGKYYHENLLCISPKELEKYGNDVTILVTTQYYRDICAQLRSQGFSKILVTPEYRLLNNSYFKDGNNLEIVRNGALCLFDILADEWSKEILKTLIINWFDFNIDEIGYRNIFSNDQYYPEEIIKLNGSEAFVDAGAYNGDSLTEFIKKTNGEFESAFAFEVDKQNFLEMKDNIDQIHASFRKKISLFNYGLLDKEMQISYETGGSGKQSTYINIIGEARETAKAVRMSDILKNKRVTFIKMDIEGSEMRALHGAEETIKNQKPKLAICVYHSPQQLWEIPLYLKSLVPEYKIYLRHHTPLEYETVCYAVI